MNDNRKKYIEELDNIKPDERLVNETIQLIRKKRQEKQNKESKVEDIKNSFNTLRFMKNLAMGMAAVFVLTIVGATGYKTYLYKSETKLNTITQEKLRPIYTNDVYEWQEINLDDFIKEIGINKINTENFAGMYLVKERDIKGKWKEYNHTKEYEFFNLLMQYLKECKGTTYIVEDFSKIDSDTTSLYVQANYCYDIYVPRDVNGGIIISVGEGESRTACYIDLTKEDQGTLAQITEIITTVGLICEEEPGTVDRNLKTVVEQPVNVNQEKIYNLKEQSAFGSTAVLKNNGDVIFKFSIDDIKKRDTSFLENLNISEINSNTEYLMLTGVKDMLYTLIGKQDWPVLFVALNNGTVGYIKMESAMKEIISKSAIGINIVNDVTDVVSLSEGAGNLRKTENEFGYNAIFVTKSDGTKFELELKELF